MADLTTTGFIVAGALSLGAEAAKTIVGETAKEAYQALRSKLSAWAGNDVAALESAPGSRARKDVLIEVVNGLPATDQKALLQLAQDLVAALKAKPPAVGLDIGRLDALTVELGRISVTDGIGARIGEAKVETFRTGDITAGK